jgi:hypothetical protein
LFCHPWMVWSVLGYNPPLEGLFTVMEWFTNHRFQIGLLSRVNQLSNPKKICQSVLHWAY